MADVVTFSHGRSRPRKTRYKPSYLPNGSVLFTAEQNRQHDIERLVERVPQRLLNRLLWARDEELWVLLTFAEGLHTLRCAQHTIDIDGYRIPGAPDFASVRAAVPKVLVSSKRRGSPTKKKADAKSE